MALTRRFFLAGVLGGAARAAQPVLAPCITSAREAMALRLVFREPRGLRGRPAQVVLLVHLRGRAPDRVRVNGRQTQLASRASGWAAIALPGGRWERVTLEPGEPFDGCNDAATAPYLVFEPTPQKK